MSEASRPQPVARVDPHPATEAAAVRAVLWRYERGLHDAEDALELLRALGLVEPAPLEGRPMPPGFDTRFKSRKRPESPAAAETAQHGETGAERLNGAHRPNQAQEEPDSGHVPHHDDERAS